MSVRRVLRNSLLSGAIATAATTLVCALAGRAEGQGAAAPINAVSHIAYGEEAAQQDGVSAKYTLVGALLNAAAVLGWAAAHELAFGRGRGRAPARKALVTGAAVSGIAYATDYHVVPKRLTPGFEERLSGRSMFAIYAALALSLAAGAMLRE